MIFNRLIDNGNIKYIENELTRENREGDKLLAFNGMFNIEISSQDKIIGKIKTSLNKRKYIVYDSTNKILLKIYLNCWKSGCKKMIIQRYSDHYSPIEYVSYPPINKNGINSILYVNNRGGDTSAKNLKFVKRETGDTIFQIGRCFSEQELMKSNEYIVDYDDKTFDLFLSFCIALVCIHSKPTYEYDKTYDGKL